MANDDETLPQLNIDFEQLRQAFGLPINTQVELDGLAGQIQELRMAVDQVLLYINTVHRDVQRMNGQKVVSRTIKTHVAEGRLETESEEIQPPRSVLASLPTGMGRESADPATGMVRGV